MDGSWSIGTENFDQIRQFLYTLVNSFDVSPDHVRVGLVQYSFTPRTEFQLNTFQDKKEILEYIENLPYSGGGTNTGKGLDFVLNKHFVESAGSRAAQSVPQIAVVITDGKSQDEVELHAERLRNKGIILYAIGIKDADADELKQIANRPYGQHVHSVSDFSALQGISQNIVQTLCTTVEEAKRQVQQMSQGKDRSGHASRALICDRSIFSRINSVWPWGPQADCRGPEVLIKALGSYSLKRDRFNHSCFEQVQGESGEEQALYQEENVRRTKDDIGNNLS